MIDSSKKSLRYFRDRTRIASGFDRVLLYQLDVLEQHRKFALRSLKDHAAALAKKVEKDITSMTDEQRSDYFDYMQDEFAEIEDAFPRLQWYAQFLLLYATFEDAMNQLCRIVKKRSQFNADYKDMEGQGIRRASIYLRKVANVEEPFKSKEWNFALLLGELRNVIAHNNGEMVNQPKNPKSLSSRLVTIPNIKLKTFDSDDPVARVLLSDEFIRDCILSIRKVVTDVCNYPLYAEDV